MRNSATNHRSARSQLNDESYVIDLCDELLGLRARRHHRFPFLKGDPNKRRTRARLPVDAYYQEINLVIEYHERQHTERHPWFDRRIVSDLTGETRREQRKRYDRLRTQILPRHGIKVIVLDCGEFGCNSSKRLRRQTHADRAVIRNRLSEFLSPQRGRKMMEAAKRTTLHVEMEIVLQLEGNKWMSLAEIAAAVNRRGRYRRIDGAPVPAAQVSARASRYGELFECRAGAGGTEVTLRRGLHST